MLCYVGDDDDDVGVKGRERRTCDKHHTAVSSTNRPSNIVLTK